MSYSHSALDSPLRPFTQPHYKFSPWLISGQVILPCKCMVEIESNGWDYKSIQVSTSLIIFFRLQGFKTFESKPLSNSWPKNENRKLRGIGLVTHWPILRKTIYYLKSRTVLYSLLVPSLSFLYDFFHSTRILRLL